MNAQHRSYRVKQSGFTLIELMIGMTLSLIVIGAAFGVYISNQKIHRTNQHIAAIHDSVRVSFEMMAREVRQAGGTPCGPKGVSNVLNERNAHWYTTWRETGLIAYSGSQAIEGIPFGSQVGQRVVDTEAIQLMSANIAMSQTVLNHDPASQTIVIQSGSGIRPNSLVVMCDGESAVLFRTANVTADQVTYTVSNDPKSNCTGNFGFFVSCSNADIKQFAAGSHIAPVTAAVWFISHGANGQTMLSRATENNTEEIADSVNSIRTSYLTLDTSGNLSAAWRPVDAIVDWGNTRAAAARVALTVQPLSNNSTSPAPQRTLTFVANLRNAVN